MMRNITRLDRSKDKQHRSGEKPEIKLKKRLSLWLINIVEMLIILRLCESVMNSSPRNVDYLHEETTQP